MLDINFIRENPEKVKEGIKKKKYDSSLVDKVLTEDKKRLELLQKVEDLRRERNELAQGSGQKSEKDHERGREVKEELKKIEPELKQTTQEFEKLIQEIPNLPLEDVPEGKDESENQVIRKWGEPKKFDFPIRDHLEIGELLGIIDTTRAAKVSGTRFAYLKGDAVLLEFALVRLAFEELIKEKFIPVVPPVIVRPEILEKMARLTEADKDERYYLQQDDMYLIGSAEHTLGPLHMDEVIPESKLPIRYVGFSTSFRREAGSYGKDTKGILRVHQFDKIEMETFSLPEKSVKEQDFIVSLQERMMQALVIPYQVVMICAGDMGAPDVRQIDIESWIPSEGKYRETHTSDLMGDYQSRRLNTKVQRKDGKTEFVHMNDATAFAVGRTIIAILENYQQKDGSVMVPEVLRPYVGKEKITNR